MLGSRVTRIVVVVIGFLVLTALPLSAATPIEPLSGTAYPGGLDWSDTGKYMWSFCATVDVSNVNLDLVLYSGADLTGNKAAMDLICSLDIPEGSSAPSGCTLGDTSGTSGHVWTCSLDSGWTEGSMEWFATATTGDASSSTDSYWINTGPSAVTLSQFAGSSGMALALVLPLMVLGGVVYGKRRP